VKAALADSGAIGLDFPPPNLGLHILRPKGPGPALFGPGLIGPAAVAILEKNTISVRLGRVIQKNFPVLASAILFLELRHGQTKKIGKPLYVSAREIHKSIGTA
jgi:hypothetical protein